jgi:predicted regulator of Ras-like GTPase activity (Roadblock/LC7/MglB family)
MPVQQAKQTMSREDGVAERLQAVLDEFKRKVPFVLGSAIADKSGLPIASDLPPRVNVMMVTAMSALAMQSCCNIRANLGLEPADRIVAESDDSIVVVRSLAGGSASLFAMMSGKVDIELARVGMDQAARNAEEILGT